MMDINLPCSIKKQAHLRHSFHRDESTSTWPPSSDVQIHTFLKSSSVPSYIHITITVLNLPMCQSMSSAKASLYS